MNDVVKNILVALKPYEAQIAKEMWEKIIHPELLKLEGQISQDQIKLIATLLDGALNKYVEEQIGKL